MLDYSTIINNMRIELFSDILRMIDTYGVDDSIPLDGLIDSQDTGTTMKEICVIRDDKGAPQSVVLCTFDDEGPFETDINELDTDTLVAMYKSIHLSLLLKTYNIEFDCPVVTFGDIENAIDRLVRENGHDGTIEGLVDMTDSSNVLNITTLETFLPDAGVTEDDIEYDDDEFDENEDTVDMNAEIDDSDIDEFSHFEMDEYGDILNVDPIWMTVSLRRYGSRGYMFHCACDELGIDEYVGLDEYDLFNTMLMYDAIHNGMYAKERYEEKMEMERYIDEQIKKNAKIEGSGDIKDEEKVKYESKDPEKLTDEQATEIMNLAKKALAEHIELRKKYEQEWKEMHQNAEGGKAKHMPKRKRRSRKEDNGNDSKDNEK